MCGLQNTHIARQQGLYMAQIPGLYIVDTGQIQRRSWGSTRWIPRDTRQIHGCDCMEVYQRGFLRQLPQSGARSSFSWNHS